jgi:hypothetical protein
MFSGEEFGALSIRATGLILVLAFLLLLILVQGCIIVTLGVPPVTTIYCGYMIKRIVVE